MIRVSYYSDWTQWQSEKSDFSDLIQGSYSSTEPQTWTSASAEVEEQTLYRYRFSIVNIGDYLYYQEYLSGPQWTEWSEEQPPASAFETETKTEYRGRVILIKARAGEDSDGHNLRTEEDAAAFCAAVTAHPEPYAYASASYRRVEEDGNVYYTVTVRWYSDWSAWQSTEPTEGELAGLVPAAYGYDTTETQPRTLYRWRRR